jgi:hypothetical protein
VSAPGVFCIVSGGQFRSGGATGACAGWAAALDIAAVRISARLVRMVLSSGARFALWNLTLSDRRVFRRQVPGTDARVPG